MNRVQGEPVRRKVTIDDIARQSGASRTTVSLVLRNKPGIGHETRQRVREVAEQLGYEQRGATNGAVEREQDVLNIGLVLRARKRDKLGALPGVNSFYSWVLAGVEAAARQQRMNLLYSTLPVDDHNEPLEFPDHVLGQRLDGVLLVGSFSEATIAEVASRGHEAIVLLDAPAGAHLFDSIGADGQSGTYVATRHLLEHGHRQIAYIGPGPGGDPNFDARQAGYMMALREAKLEPIYGRMTKDNAAKPTEELLRDNRRITALVACNDVFAINAIQVAKKLGLRVPDDLSIIGFDDIDLSAQITPALTTMAVDKITMGRLAIQTLAFRRAWPDAAKFAIVTQTELLVRNSVGPVRRPQSDT
jgi:LacI family transcriptional regulator